ncbi:transcriptional regulator with XRE-family HTH domain [Neobacillus niacini]|uniref:helix-turn-helix domain-containing protein n=1 Tax=Neobacillus driksii TaxID=3035913 RepID=UPI00278350B7|nr:helix-turn-helix transcriptional regulator [Neobacillus niacini]MDQ0976663.1 transcriptional regulator with XRE-family HTH domain [Neobacillus niacini]
MIVKVHDKTNEQVVSNLEKFPYFTIRCKLGEVLKERGLKMQELSDLTGIRVATISEMVNMKRSTLNVPHIIVIAQALRIDDISKLFEFIMPDDTKEIFTQDQEIIAKEAILPEQEEYLTKMRQERKNPTTD